ncbi:MAG TPA: transglycosylase domain-containing protein, partial [Paracoccus sp. (in: a-proteobacteria)]|nr:transglycosylase domain-containing protein [Paracoccus sp. (in: a-proteobacteria)]
MPRNSNDLTQTPKRPARRGVLRALRVLWGWIRWIGLRLLALMFVLVFLFSFINPPSTWTIIQGQREYPGKPAREWVDLDEVSPHVVRAVVAAEDANFCAHWGFDMTEIRKVIASGS